MLEELRETHPTHAGVAQLAALLAEDSRNSQCVFEIVDDALALNPPPITHAMFLSALGACYITLGDMYVYYFTCIILLLLLFLFAILDYCFSHFDIDKYNYFINKLKYNSNRPKAKESLQKALEIFPDSDSALGHLISLHISQRQFTEAHALADQALSKKFPMSVLMGYQAKIEIHLLEAEEYAKKAYELDNNPMTRQQYFTLKQFTQRK